MGEPEHIFVWPISIICKTGLVLPRTTTNGRARAASSANSHNMDEILRAGTSFQFCIKVSQSKFLCMLVGAGAARGVFVGIFKVKDFFVRVFLGVLSISYVSQANILQIASVHLPYLLTHPRHARPCMYPLG